MIVVVQHGKRILKTNGFGTKLENMLLAQNQSISASFIKSKITFGKLLNYGALNMLRENTFNLGQTFLLKSSF